MSAATTTRPLTKRWTTAQHSAWSWLTASRISGDDPTPRIARELLGRFGLSIDESFVVMHLWSAGLPKPIAAPRIIADLTHASRLAGGWTR